jgi:hypothetical protein
MKSDDVIPEFAPILVGKRSVVPHDDQACHDYPTLMQLLLPRAREDGRLTREAGVLSIRVDGGCFSCTLICPTEGVQATLLTGSFSNLLLQLEEWSASNATAWVPTRDSKKRTRRGLDKSLE